MYSVKPVLPRKPILPLEPNLNSPQHPNVPAASRSGEKGGGRTDQRRKVKHIALHFRGHEGTGAGGPAPERGASLNVERRLKHPFWAGQDPIPALPTSSMGEGHHVRREKESGEAVKRNQCDPTSVPEQEHPTSVPEQEHPTSVPEQEHRSAPDGSEVAKPEGVTAESKQSSPAPPSPQPSKHCHCTCHLQRPGMKLVWVPLQQEENHGEDVKTERRGKGKEDKKEGEGEEDKSTGGEKKWDMDQKGGKTSQADPQHVLDMADGEGNRQRYASSQLTASERALLEGKCINCHSFLIHHSLPKGTENMYEFVYETMDGIVKPPSTKATLEPKTKLRLTASLNVHRLQKSRKPTLVQLSFNSVQNVDPKREIMSTGGPPVPPRRLHEMIKNPSPPPVSRALRPLPALPNKIRAPRPAIGHTLSLRGGYLPIRHKADVGESADSIDPWEMIEEDEISEHAESPRRISSDWEHKQDEPLYQIYQAKVIKEAIRNQTESPSGRRSGVDALGLESHGRVGAARRDFTLWQELPVVKKSGVLEKLSPVERQRQESMFEVVTSEASYLCSLRVLRDHFLGSRELNETLVFHDRKALFSNSLQVYEVSERFMGELLERVDENVLISDVCDIIHRHAQSHFSVYTDYVRNQAYQEKTYSSLMQTNRLFAVVMRRLEESPLCRRLPFNSFLLLPFQRITRIKILIQNILKRTAEGTGGEQTASKALSTVSEIIKEANTQVGQMKQMEELIHIHKMLDFHKLRAVPIVSKTRYLEKQGELQELTKGGSLFSIRLKFIPVYFFLFNDLLILTTKKSPERFVVFDHTHRSLVHVQAVEEVEPGPQLAHSFCLTLLENHQGQSCERLLKANTESDMHRWMAAFPALIDPYEERKETLYDDWDCPQMQCVNQYTARQADELSLEPTDIINILRKTQEGWYEGIRLSDGQKGWFPSKVVLEITNEHQRRRNLREQYRIARAESNANPNP